MAFKINESIIVIQAEATSPNRTNVVFWSHDRGTAKLRMKLVRKNGIPQSLPEGTTVPIRLMFKSATAEGGYGKHDYLATIEDRVNGIVSIVLEDNILGYVGIVEGSVYIDFPNDRSLDTAGRFTFDIKRSPIDDSTPELEDYYFNGFSQTIDKIEKILADGKQEIEQKIAESETQIDAKVKDTNDKITKANQDVATLNTNIDKANDRIDQTNQQIGDLGKLKKMYSNSIDFGDYDYSGNPNLMKNVYSSTWSKLPNGSSQPNPYTKIFDDYIITDATDPSADNIGRKTYVPTLVQLQGGKEYTISVTMMVDEAFNSGGDSSYNNSAVHYAMYADGQEVLPVIIRPNTTMVNQYQRVSATFTMPTNIKNVDYAYFFVYESKSVTGKWYIKNDIKIEEGPTATPFQPNLLAEPYNMCPEYPNENIVNPTVKFPIKTSNNPISGFDISEELIIGETYTVSLKGTKPANKEFHLYYGDANYQQSQSQYQATLLPVEGLANVWSATFTARNTSETTNLLRVALWQKPNSATYGTVQIDWLKIEKGDTRTPNISQFKYFGEGLKDSNNPNDYSWDITPEYAEKGLNNTVSLTEPETVLGLKNFKDGVQIDGVDVATVKNLGSVLQSGSGLTTIQSDKQSAFDEFSYEFERIGDRVFFHARVKTNSTTAVASHVNLLEIPLGFQFPIGWTIVGVPLSVVQWTTPQGEISALVITDSTGKQVVKFATNRVGNHYISGEWRTADSYPETK
ncbi:BppU family phage baseplate upper protein [Enterococcus faecium]|uniref:BppU family phage baseplate upper protein n=2 Tax=Enterococcus faecium TaxID=1352 RepID=UPI00200C3BD7|nr:BppU family phage baseplate upper protein [Enterococcus faecium]MDQ8267222.1 BppU family phage baseplate upper protein [Enterococcus faecium]UQF60225.1 BppU family phage baseplate upper protein [Enterococcus faecium]